MTATAAQAPVDGGSRDDSWRAWLAAASALALAYAIYVGRGGPGAVPFAFLAVAIACAAAAVLAGTPPRWLLRRRVGKLLAFGLAVQFALLFVWPLTNPLALGAPIDYMPFWLGLGLAAIIAGTPMLGFGHSAWWRTLALVGVHLSLGAWVITAAPEPHIDVWVMQADGARALTAGVNPYLPIYPNLHGDGSPYYGPGLVVDGELTIGFPYPPLSLLLVLPAELFAGDPRFAHLLAVGLTAIVIAAVRPGPVATGAALLYLFTPWTFFLVVGAWTEPLVVLSVALVALTAVRTPSLVGGAAGLMLAVKQYMLIGLPLAIVLLATDARARWRIGWQAAGLAALVSVPFVVWDPGAFWWSTVGSLAGQVFRPDSLTFLALLPGEWGPRLSPVAFLLVLAVGALIVLRGPRGPFGFAASTALLLLVFFSFSRQGSANYHVAVIGALCCAVAASSIPNPGGGQRRSTPLVPT